MFESSTGIFKCHDILIKIIPYQKMYGQIVDQGANLLHGTIGMMNCYNNGLGSPVVNLFL